jgi:hypothetical protein
LTVAVHWLQISQKYLQPNVRNLKKEKQKTSRFLSIFLTLVCCCCTQDGRETVRNWIFVCAEKENVKEEEAFVV